MLVFVLNPLIFPWLSGVNFLNDYRLNLSMSIKL
jgi:hypothetical protein